jgi:solute:Na+ symporter, SSS family
VFWGAVTAQSLIFALFFLRHRFPALDFSYLWYNLIGCVACMLFSRVIQALPGVSPPHEPAATDA